jgi:hypothetical protein
MAPWAGTDEAEIEIFRRRSAVHASPV